MVFPWSVSLITSAWVHLSFCCLQPDFLVVLSLLGEVELLINQSSESRNTAVFVWLYLIIFGSPDSA